MFSATPKPVTVPSRKRTANPKYDDEISSYDFLVSLMAGWLSIFHCFTII
jgi:hypothetical protein